MRYRGGEHGGVPVLAIFTIFSIILAGAAIAHFRLSGRRQATTIRLLMATDIARARASAIESDLNDALETAITAAMWEVGMGAGAKENVENRVIKLMNNRISQGWNYLTVDENIPQVDENNLIFEWQPDGSVIAHGLLDATIKHVKGPTAHGIRLFSSPPVRFRRIKKVAELTENIIKTTNPDLDQLERELNDNYRAEGIRVIIKENAGRVNIMVKDIFGAQTVILPD